MRILDNKFHLEGEQIIKTSNGQAVPENEPLFFFRGRDRLALPALVYYLKLCVEDGCTDYQLKGLEDRIAAFQKFSSENPMTMKQPGITRGQ